MTPTPLLAAAGGPDIWSALPMMAVVLGIMYFVAWRPQQQERAALEKMLSALVKDDVVVTGGGLHGRVAEIDGEVLVIEIADKVRVRIDRSAVARKLAK